MRKVGFLYDDIYLRHETPPWHPESKERLVAILEHLKGSSLHDRLIHLKPRRAGFEEIALVHTPGYIEEVKRHGPGYLDPDTYASENTLEAALYAAGAVLEAVDRCRQGELDRAFCAVRPPGHHAEADRAMGFCIFNNVAVGARYAQRAGYERVFIVDFDVHHGNGTQHSFESDDAVFYFSTHQHPHYPGTGSASEKGKGKGEGFTYNAPLPVGTGDRELYPLYCDILPALMEKFRPDIVLVSAGYDIHAKDPLAGFRVTDEGLRSIVQGILSYSLDAKPLPFIFSLEGGYDLDALGRSVVITLEELLKE
ncbi:MAG: histone deacetylase [Thermodesulfovibrionales bacterium]